MSAVRTYEEKIVTAVASALIGRAGHAVASRLKTMLRHDDPGLGYAVFIELEVVHEKVCLVLVVEDVDAWLVYLGGLGRGPVRRRGPAALEDVCQVFARPAVGLDRGLELPSKARL